MMVYNCEARRNIDAGILLYATQCSSRRLYWFYVDYFYPFRYIIEKC